jgi:hypothetical protein
MLVINLDLSPLQKLAADGDAVLKQAAKRAGDTLAPAVHAHVLEEANKKLHSRRKKFVDAVSFKQQNDSTWLIILDASARWIDDGTEPHEMIDSLLSKRTSKSQGAKTARDGSKYRIIPFEHGPGKGPGSSTPAEASLQQAIKKELRRAQNNITGEKGIPWGKLEVGKDGKPLTGLLHSLDIRHSPVKTANGPGQGWGPIGGVKQGKTGIPFLQGVRIYQRAVKGADGKERVQRSIMTFRTVSSKHKGTGRWFHPGLEPVHIFDEAHKWGKDKWEKEVLPSIIDWVSKQL